MGAKELFDARHATFATTRSHTDSRRVLQLIDGDDSAASNHCQNLIQLHIFAMANVSRIFAFGSKRLHINTFAESFFENESSNFGEAFAGDVGGFYARHIGLVRLLHHFFNDSLSYFLS